MIISGMALYVAALGRLWGNLDFSFFSALEPEFQGSPGTR